MGDPFILGGTEYRRRWSFRILRAAVFGARFTCWGSAWARRTMTLAEEQIRELLHILFSFFAQFPSVCMTRDLFPVIGPLTYVVHVFCTHLWFWLLPVLREVYFVCTVLFVSFRAWTRLSVICCFFLFQFFWNTCPRLLRKPISLFSARFDSEYQEVAKVMEQAYVLSIRGLIITTFKQKEVTATLLGQMHIYWKHWEQYHFREVEWRSKI